MSIGSCTCRSDSASVGNKDSGLSKEAKVDVSRWVRAIGLYREEGSPISCILAPEKHPSKNLLEPKPFWAKIGFKL